MTKIDANMKVSKVDAGSAAPEFKSQGAAEGASGTGDSYSQAAANPYAGLVSGNPKAVEMDTSLDQLVEAYVAEKTPARRRSPMQEFIKRNFMMGVPDAAPPPVPDNVNVPKFHRDIVDRNPGIIKKTATLKPVVERYKELKAMLERLLQENKSSLAVQNSKNMTPWEVRALIKHREVLEDKLARCSDELKEAQFYYRWADKNEKAAKATAEAREAAENR